MPDRKNLRNIARILFLLALPTGALAATLNTQGVVAVVNDKVISNYDLDQRVALFFATSNIQPTKEAIDQIRPQVLRGLIDETIELKEAEKFKVTIDKEDIDNSVANLAAQNGVTVKEITENLGKAGVAIGTLRTQIGAEIVWNRLVQGRFGTQVKVTVDDVDNEMDRLKAGADKPQFQTAEIFLAVDVPEDDERVKKDADQVVAQLKNGVPFSSLARQFSQLPSAAQGGDIGWVVDGQLPDELNTALKDAQSGQILGPIKSTGGYYILFLRNRREPEGTVAPVATTGITAPVPLARLLLPLPPGNAALKQRALALGADIQKNVRSCEQLQKLSTQIQGSVYMSLGTMRVSDLAKDVQNALQKTQPGEIADPFISSAGVEIFARCDPPVPQILVYELPTRSEIENQLFVEQMSVIGRRYLRDLRRDAVVEMH